MLIIGIVFVYSQLEYIKNKDPGFDKDQRLVFTFNTGESFQYIPALMDDLRQLAGVRVVSNSSKFLSNPALFSNVFRRASARPMPHFQTSSSAMNSL